MSDLNQKILTLIQKHSNVCDEKGHTVVDDFSYQDLANDIQIVLLESQIELLRPLLTDKFVYETVENKISELKVLLNKEK